jgi:splicing factor 3B subunit 3
MFVYNLTLQPSNFITQSIVGNFSGNKSQEVIVAKNSLLEMYRPDVNTGQMIPIVSQHVFGVIRSLCPFKLPGGSKGIVPKN